MNKKINVVVFLERWLQKEVGQENEKERESKGLICQKMKRTGEKKLTDSKREKKKTRKRM